MKSFTQRIKLPNLNRSHYNGFNMTKHDTIKDAKRLYGSVETHKRVSNPKSSIVTKQNNVFTTKDSDVGGYQNVQKHMANNFRVQIKNQLNTSMDQFNRTQFIDLHQSARNSGSYGMQVHSLKDRNDNKESASRLQS